MRMGVPWDSAGLFCRMAPNARRTCVSCRVMQPGRDCCTLSIRYRALCLCQRGRAGAGNVSGRRAKAMWQNLSLRGRINLLLALLLALGLAVNIGRQVAEACPRVQAEDQSVIRLSREFI